MTSKTIYCLSRVMLLLNFNKASSKFYFSSALILFSLITIFSLSPNGDQLLAQPQGFDNGVLVFEDEFDGTAVNESNWTLLTGDGTDFGLPPGWGNNELQWYLPENATVSGGFLTITAKEESVMGYNYTSARMITANKQDFTYGRFEMRAKMPIGQGIWPAYWMFFTGPGDYGGWAASGEIDIMEYIGSEPNEVFGTIHYGQPFPGNVFTGNDYILPSGTFNDDFHTFAVEWEPGELRWYVDNILYATQTNWWSNGGPYPAPFDKPFHLLLNLAVGGNLPGNPDGSTVFPQEYIIDYVRVYQDADLPTVAVTVDNATPAAGDNLLITAAPTAPLGVSKIEYFQGEFKLGETTAAPHELTVNNLAEGVYRVRAKITDVDGNINYSDFVDVIVGASPQGPYSMTPFAIPGMIEAEHFDAGGQGIAYNDTDPAVNEGSRSNGGVFRTDEGVDIEATADVGGGENIGFTEIGEWLEYTVDVAAAGFYNINLRVASLSSTGPIRIQFDGVEKTGPINFVPTGGFQTWADVVVPNISLDAGVQTMRITFDGTAVNINKMTFTEAGPPAQTVFDDMEHGDPGANGWFVFGGAVGGGGIDPNPTDLPPQNGGNFSLQTGWGSGGTPGFFGGFGRTNPTSLPTATFFNFWINPDADQDYLLEINLQEDDNSDGAINAPDDDEFQYNLTVGPAGSGSEVTAGGGWQLVSIPLANFFDDNSFLFGGNGVLDMVAPGDGGNGELINVVIAVISNSGADVTFRTDYWAFSNGPLSPDLAVTPLFNDFGEVPIGACKTQAFLLANNGGLALDVSALNFTGMDPGDFTIVNGNAPFTLAPGATQIVEVSFSPVTEGSKSATLSVESNDPDSNPFEVPLTGEGVEAIKVIFDDMEHGNPFENNWFAFGGSVGGGGIGPNSDDLPPQNGGNFSLQTGWGSGGVQGFFGGFGREFPLDLAGYDHFNFWINPDAGQDYTLEINFQEDDNGDGGISSPEDDEFQYNLKVGPAGSGAEVISGGGWQLVSIPFSALFDDNSFLTGGNGTFDPISTTCGGDGGLVFVVIAVIGDSGSDAVFRTDFWAFSNGPLAPIIDVTPEEQDFGEVYIGSCNEQVFTVTNKGCLELDITSITLDPADGDFSIISGGDPLTLAAETSHEIVVYYTPTSLGEKTAMLIIESTDPDDGTINIPLSGVGLDPSKVVFDDMEHADPFGNGWFTFTGAGGGGIDPNFVDLPPTLGGSVSLQTGWGSGGNPGFFGGFGRTNPIDISQNTHFNFWINPDAGQDFLIEIQLQEDDNGDNNIPFPPDGMDDEFQYNLRVGPADSGAEVISGGGWQLVSIPLADFFDDNSFHFGGNGIFDPSPAACGGNGQLINAIFGIISNSGADATFRTDFWSFTDVPLKPEFEVTAAFDDFTKVIGDSEFLSNDTFVLPAGDCHSDPSFTVEALGGCGELSIAATNLTTGAFLQATGPDAFGDFVFEMDDITKGTYTVEVIVSDEEGNTSSATFGLTLVDETGPTLDIPGGTLSLQAPSVCEGTRLQVWSLQADDDCDGETLVEVVSVEEQFFFGGPAPFFYDDDFSGDQYGLLFLELGDLPFQVDPSLDALFYTIVVRSTDASGNVTEKTWFVEVVAPAVSGINSLACNDGVNVALNNNCYAPLFPDAVLEGIPSACEGNYYVKVAYPYDGYSINAIRKFGTFKYTVYAGDPENPDTENDTFICWGEVTGEDKTPPTGCIDKVVGLRKTRGSSTPIVRHGETIDTEIKADYFGAKEGKQAFKKINGDYWYYEPLTSMDVCPGDGIDEEFDLGNRNDNLLICTDVDSILNVSASYSDKNYAYYTGTPYVTDNCIAPGWEPKLLKVTDRLIDFDCDYLFADNDPNFTALANMNIPGRRVIAQLIERKFVFEDEKGNKGETIQYICFFKPRIKLPNCKETFDVCWFGADNELNPSEIGSYPSIVNGACMEMPLLEHICNLTVTYEDLRLPGPVHCGDKVIRTWTILDWCWDPITLRNIDIFDLIDLKDSGCPDPTFSDWDGKTLTWEQHLIIGGSDDIVVECPAKDPEWYGGSDAPTFSVGPFNCEASIEVPAPIIKKDGKASNACQSTWTVEIYAEVDELWHGVPTGNKVIEYYDHAVITEDIDEVNWVTNGVTVSKLPKGAYYFKYVAKDLCGGTAYSEYCKFFIIDEIAPVAICDDDLNISIGGDNYSRVYAKDIDEGSYDSCSDIELTARRFIPEDCFDAFVANTEWSACDIYVATRGRCSSTDPITLNKPASVYDGTKGYYTPWFDYVDFTCCDIKGEVLIELRARDNANMSRDAKGEPIYGDNVKPFPSFSVNQKDNENICWLEVFVEDKLPPICQAPKDKEIDCEDIPYDLPEVSKHTSEGKNGITWGAEELADPANALIVEWLNSFDDAERPAAVDNCDARVEMTKVKFVIHCKAGYIERTFQATDDWGLTSSNSCKQRIWIARHHDYCIKFPKDAEAECKEAPEVPTVEFFEYGCDLLAVSIQDERFNSDIDKGDNSECYKIFRTYRVLNWCQFDEDIDPDLPLFDRFDTEYHLDPLVVGRDEDCDGWPGDEDVYVRFKGKENKSGVLEGTTWIDSDCEPWNDSPKASKHQCDNPWGHWEEIPGYTAGFYQYTQVIKVYDDVAPVVTSVGEERFPTYASPGKGDDKAAVCVGQVDRMFEADDDCTPDHVKIDRVILKPDPALGLGPIILLERGALSNNAAGFGFSIDQDGVKFTLSGQFPIGSHVFEVRVADGCNITAGIDLPFEVFDDKAPAPICNSALSVELMPVDADNDGTRDAGVGMVEVWAKDFIASEIWDCSEPITYSIERAADIDGGAEPDADNTNLMLNCDDAAAGVVLVYIYAWDAVGNRDRCEAMVIVDDAMEVCGDGAPVGIVSGLIYTEDNRAVPGVEVQVSGQAADAAMTPQNGAYNFGLPAGGDYTVTPFLDLDHKNGVSTADLVQISKHILGVEALNSPYRMIAADVNASASITTLDLIMLRKLILSIDKEFSNNTSWRFVDASYSFPDATNPWREAFPEVINVNDLEADALIEGDFIAVKIGDTNFSANAGDLIQEREIAGTFNINVLDQAVSAGQEYEIEFTATDLANIEGYQFTLNYTDAVALVDIKEGVAVAENFGLTHTEDNVITTSWNGASSEEVLFTLVVRANADVALSEVFTIGSLYTQAEAYNTEEELLDVAIDFGSEVVSAASLYELGQNQPNPFKGMTEIKYIVPEAGEATLTITDMTGKVISIVTQDAAKGLNRIELNSNDLPSGVLYYTLESADFTATKKMINIE